MGLSLFFLLGQAVTGVPALPVGAEVRLVSQDLLTVYASAKVGDQALVLEGVPPAGTAMRVLIFPADASAAQRAATLSGALAIHGLVSADGNDILLQIPGEATPRSLRELLWQERGLVLRLQAAEED